MKPKKKSVFRLPYLGMDQISGNTILYGERGDFSAIFHIRNLAAHYGADESPYILMHTAFVNLIKILGEGYYIQKQDVFAKKSFQWGETDEYLQNKYRDHFRGRKYAEINTYLIITKQIKKGAFYVYDPKSLTDFGLAMEKVLEMLHSIGMKPKRLDEYGIQNYVNRILGMDFTSSKVPLDNIKATDTELQIANRSIRSISLINIETIDLPEKVGTYTLKREGANIRDFPVDNLTFLHHVPAYETIIYNQLLEIPNQQNTLAKMELKKKRHSGIPDPGNMVAVEDIEQLLTDVARDNQLLVNVHFNILIATSKNHINKVANFVENALLQQGIIPSRNSYNQLELFRSALPGNSTELKSYDWFLTTSDAATCFIFKETYQQNEDSDFLIHFTDRQGVPIAIDPADLRSGRISNRSKFTLGPSGSGKSFFLNATIEQYCLFNMDVVIIDTGHSYSGLCNYYKGKYITYSEENPISMNPFKMSRQEFNLEKKDFLKTLIALIWKGAEGHLTQVEDAVISNVLSSFFYEFFWLDPGPTNPNRPSKLNFDSFYNYSVDKIKEITEQESIIFDLDEYRYILRKFYSGQEYGTMLNEDADKTLFDTPFIVFEIDNIKENRLLLGIVTLIIMDVFLQKMRLKSTRRKALIVEEAWKAIASPLMATYLVYLYKTVRKFWGEVNVVTQELADILGNEIVKDSIIANSDTVCLLDQSKYKENYDEIAKLLSISDSERKKIFSINQLDNKEGRGAFKEVYIRRGNTGEVYGVEVSLHQYLTYTTEKPEKVAIENYVRLYGAYPQALDAFIADLTKSGLKLEQFVSKVNNANGPFLQLN